jgi:hypothetical protein
MEQEEDLCILSPAAFSSMGLYLLMVLMEEQVVVFGSNA